MIQVQEHAAFNGPGKQICKSIIDAWKVEPVHELDLFIAFQYITKLLDWILINRHVTVAAGNISEEKAMNYESNSVE